MNNFFDSEDSDFFQLKGQKCLHNTGHTTGNGFQNLYNVDNFNQNFLGQVLGKSQEGLIHFSDEPDYLQNLQDEPQALQLLSDQQQEERKDQALQLRSGLFQNSRQAGLQNKQKTQTMVDTKQKLEVSERIQIGNCPQLTRDYRVSKKWKEKLKGVVEQKSIHQFSAKHNRNMAKFFVRLYSKYAKLSAQPWQSPLQIQQKLQEITENKCISLKDLQNLFGCQSSLKSRQLLTKILRKSLKQQVIKSQDVQNKAAYLICSKVYALRCRSRHLIGRLQSR